MMYHKTAKNINRAHIILRNCEAELSELFGHVVHLSIYHVRRVKPKPMSQEKFDQLNELKVLASKFELLGGLNSGDLEGKSRSRKISDIRSMFMVYASKKYTSVIIGLSLNRNHATVICARRKFEKLQIYKEYREMYEKIISHV